MTKNEKIKIAMFIAEVFGCPCDYSPLDEEVQEYCNKNYEDCVDDDTGCWLRVIDKIIFDEEGDPSK